LRITKLEWLSLRTVVILKFHENQPPGAEVEIEAHKDTRHTHTHTYIHTYIHTHTDIHTHIQTQRMVTVYVYIFSSRTEIGQGKKYVNKWIWYYVELFDAKLQLGTKPSDLQKIGTPLICNIALSEAPQNWLQKYLPPSLCGILLSRSTWRVSAI
jgi:hypothetical protein